MTPWSGNRFGADVELRKGPIFRTNHRQGISIYHRKSAPRKTGEGAEDEEQEIVGVERLGNGGLQVRALALRCPLAVQAESPQA